MAQLTRARSSWQSFGLARLTAAAPILLLCAAIGIELMVLVTWLPDTFEVWFRPNRAGFGDFPFFYRQAKVFGFNATYSPGLTVLIHPLTLLSMRHAFWIYTGVNVGALIGIAYAAQSGVRSPAAKAAMALGVLALPQAHWALRVGHFTPVLALATLGGLLLARRRPVVAGLLIGVLALKPQYIIVPLLYLAWTRNWRALAACVGTLAGLGVAGIGAGVLIMGPQRVGEVAHHYAVTARFVAHFLTVGQEDQLYVQGWQYSWYGFLVSAGIDPNPLLAADLLLLSLGAMLLAWWKCTPSVARVATVLGMLLLTPHSTFYNWTIIAVAGVLLVRSDLRPRWLIPAMIAGVALAAAATQKATPFPVPVDLYRPAGTRGLFWIQPAALAALFTLAIAGRRRGNAEPSEASEPSGFMFRTPRLAMPAMPNALAWSAVAAAMLAAGYLGGAYVSNSVPFRSEGLFSRTTVLNALPVDFPVVPGSRVEGAGAGTRLPYRVEWDTPAAMSEVAGIMRQRLADGTWKIVDSSIGEGDDVRLRSARAAGGSGTPVIAEVDIIPNGRGSRVRVEFSPLPTSSVPNYDKWLASVGIIVHNVDPSAPPPTFSQ